VEPSFEDNEGRDFTEYFDELLDILEVPFKSYGNLPVILKILNRAHENNSRIILNGQCGNTTVSYGKIEEALNHLFSKHRYISFVRYYNNYFKLIKASRKKYFIPTVKYYAGLNATNTAVKTDIKSGNQFVNQGLIDSFDISKRSSYLAFATQQLITEDTYIQKLYYTPSFTYIGASETKTGLYTGMVIRDATRSIDILDFCNSVPFEFFCADGVPRALIRYCMEDFVPYELRYPITQRGLQSADWMERLKAHSDEIYKRLDENVESVPESNSEYLNRNEMKRFVAERVPIDYENKDPYLFLFNAIVMNKFLNKNVTDMQE
jgi:asparagine synthase (glutamine-hydrolysing)